MDSAFEKNSPNSHSPLFVTVDFCVRQLKNYRL